MYESKKVQNPKHFYIHIINYNIDHNKYRNSRNLRMFMDVTRDLGWVSTL